MNYRKKLGFFTVAMFLILWPVYASKSPFKGENIYKKVTPISTPTNPVLEPYTYYDDFANNELGAWASYPLWQDTAYDQKFHTGEIVLGDPNISIVQKVIPYSHVDNYAGAQKLLDMYLVPGATVSFRYFIKTNEHPKFLKVRFAAGKYGKLDVTIPHPKTNHWVRTTVTFKDFAEANPSIAGKKKIRIYALAFLTEIPKADPAMPFYLGLDDIKFKGARKVPFHFSTPAMYKLPEFKPLIPKKPYKKDQRFTIKGHWSVGAKRVTLQIFPYTDVPRVNKKKPIYKAKLSKKSGLWKLNPIKLSFPVGLYLGKLAAWNGNTRLSQTEFTIHITPSKRKLAGVHPRLIFDANRKKWIQKRFKKKRFQPVLKKIVRKAKKGRKNYPLSSIVYDLDQFPSKHWLPSWNAFGKHIYATGPALKYKALAYTFAHNHKAGEYAKNALVKFVGWPQWISPWLIRRGRFSEHRLAHGLLTWLWYMILRTI
jgi:hypothetical protein